MGILDEIIGFLSGGGANPIATQNRNNNRMNIGGGRPPVSPSTNMLHSINNMQSKYNRVQPMPKMPMSNGYGNEQQLLPYSILPITSSLRNTRVNYGNALNRLDSMPNLDSYSDLLDSYRINRLRVE